MPSGDREAGVFGTAIVSFVVSVILFAASLLIKTSASLILLVLAALTSGYEFIIGAFHDLLNKDYLSRNVLLIFCCALLFIIGAKYEGGVLFIACKTGKLFFNYAEEKTCASAYSLLDYCSRGDKEKIEDILERETYITFNLYTISSSASIILKLTIIFALIFAISGSFLFKFSFNEAVRRSIGIIVICNTFSIEAFSKSLYNVALCRFANKGVIFHSAQDISDCSICDSVAIEKNRVLSDNSNGNVSVFSNLLESEKMLSICAHAVYKSSQPFAKAISAKYTGDIYDKFISNFKEIPGIGVGVMISGMHIILATNEFYMRKGIQIPQEDAPAGSDVYYLTINENYAGYITIGESVNDDYLNLTDKFRAAGFESCALITDDEKEEAEKLAIDFGFDYFYPNCSEETATTAIRNYASNSRNVLYLNSEDIVYDDAVCNITTARSSNLNHIYNDSIDLMPRIKTQTAKIRKTEERNAIIAFVIKSLLIIVALSGLGSSWFSVFIDLIAATVTVIISSLNLKN